MFLENSTICYELLVIFQKIYLVGVGILLASEMNSKIVSWRVLWKVEILHFRQIRYFLWIGL